MNKIPDIRFKSFDWDSGNWPKCGKHGVNKEDIEFMFKNRPMIFKDPMEDRFRAVGQVKGRNIFVVFQLRLIENKIRIRPISARYMHIKEVNTYETTKKDANT